MEKKLVRMRRATKTRSKIKSLDMPRLCVHRTPNHIYVQVIMPNGAVVAAASTVDQEVKKECEYGGNIKAASIVGKLIAVRLKKIGSTKVAFDRSGFRYHGRVKALAESARENGLEF